MEKAEGMTLKAVLERIRDIEIELATMSYSQSDPGAMMERRRMRKEKEKLDAQLAKLIVKKND
jgi:hypothetical protein